MADLVVDGITLKANVEYLNTGEVKEFTPDLLPDVCASMLSRIPLERLLAFPEAPKDAKPSLHMDVYPDGRREIRRV